MTYINSDSSVKHMSDNETQQTGEDEVQKSGNSNTVRVVASSAMLVTVVLLLLYLTFIPVPEENKDLIVTILGVILGAAATASPNLFGDNNEEELKLLRKKILKLETANKVLNAKHDALQTMLIERHVVKGEGIDLI